LGANDERVLMLQEVQSDWAQRARRAARDGEKKHDDEVAPPFMKEWVALTMKLVLLHAAHHGLDAVGWTRGVHQAHRWKGLGAAGLIELYDRSLPRDVNRMMKPFGVACEAMGIFVPTNFSIKRTENGYEVYSPENELLGTAMTLEDARQFVPDQGHELLHEVHAVRLSESKRKAILDRGFPAWG
jgi:GNAT superfamily N-acetyltransferase